MGCRVVQRQVWFACLADVSGEGTSHPEAVRANQQTRASVWRKDMKSRVAMWASVGFLIAGCWAAYAFVTPPDSFLMSLREPLVRAALYLSCPVSYAGRFYPIKFWWVLLINGATYGDRKSVV